MQIPEKLNKLSEKELKKILTNNIFESKYIINIDYGKIFEIETKVGKYIYPTGNRDRISINSLQRKDYYAPLTYESLQRFRTSNILNKVQSWNYKTFFNWCLKQFNDVYGKEFVDAQDNYIIVWFPEITINNSLEQSHIMRDIYLKFRISDSGVKLYSLKRGTLTDVEIRNNYTFSHVNNYNDVFRWSESFCFGQTTIANLRDELNRIIKCVKNLRFFLEAIKEYLSWESLEGVPYRKIDDVIYDVNLYQPFSDDNYNYQEAVDVVLNDIESFTYTFGFGNSEYHILLSDSSKEEICNILEQHYPEQMFPFLNGHSVRKNEIQDEEYDIPEHIYFKGEYRPFKLIKTDSNELDLPKKINSNFLANVVDTIESKFNKFLKQKKINDYKG